ncbi:MAG TPA: dTMP kinase [Gemmatimonadales bacterium]|nr:dTMP kinase [Gemmatimonadales bacterium]
MSGFFLVLEGPEGAGKTTLAAALIERIRSLGLDPVAVREPGGTPPAEHARRALLDPESRLEPHVELLFVAAARAHLVQSIIRPALAAGRIVVSDRYDLSTVAYQGAGRGLPAETVAAVNQVATGGLRPDLTLVLDVPPAVGIGRQQEAGKSRDRFEREGRGFHERVYQAYRTARGPGVRQIDGTGSPEAVLSAAWSALADARPETFGGARDYITKT